MHESWYPGDKAVIVVCIFYAWLLGEDGLGAAEYDGVVRSWELVPVVLVLLAL